MAWIAMGQRGNSVKNIQGLLFQAGFYDGYIDGQFGVKTDRALRAWQTELGVTPDGRWGPETMDASMRKLAEVNSQEALQQGYPPVVPSYGKAGQ